MRVLFSPNQVCIIVTSRSSAGSCRSCGLTSCGSINQFEGVPPRQHDMFFAYSSDVFKSQSENLVQLRLRADGPFCVHSADASVEMNSKLSIESVCENSSLTTEKTSLAVVSCSCTQEVHGLELGRVVGYFHECCRDFPQCLQINSLSNTRWSPPLLSSFLPTNLQLKQRHQLN